jgi:hypothetical protein
VKEQSHKDEMSAALRGDFQRLRERGVAATLSPVDTPAEPVAAPSVEPHDERAPEDETATAVAPEPVVEAVASDEADASAPARQGFLDRLLGR